MDGNNKTLSRPCFKVIYVNSTMILTYSHCIHCISFWWFCAWAGIGKTGRIWDGTYLSNGWDHNGYQAVDAAQICVQMQLRWWHGLCLWLGSSLQTTSRAHGMASPTWSWTKLALKLRTDMGKKENIRWMRLCLAFPWLIHCKLLRSWPLFKDQLWK